jgi:hypothetical protein
MGASDIAAPYESDLRSCRNPPPVHSIALGDNLTELDSTTGAILGTVGSSAVIQHGLLNTPASITFVGQNILATNLGLFSEPWSVAEYLIGVAGAGGNGNL